MLALSLRADCGIGGWSAPACVCSRGGVAELDVESDLRMPQSSDSAATAGKCGVFV